ncbi:MAG: flagellar biosynthesis protein FlgL [Hyphomicrobiales bacterium]|nr:flagellar biosynthesis protein FlgL [Hyphomicrobiales bacterium]
MSISNISSPLSVMAQRLTTMRAEFDDLQRQLATGKQAETYADLGRDASLSIGFRAKQAAIAGYQDTIRDVGLRLDMMQTALTRLDEIALEAKGAITSHPFELTNGKQTTAQQSTRERLEEMASLLNSNVHGRYLFAGMGTDRPPVLDIDTIFYGDGTADGLQQVVSERRSADLGADNLGRLTLTAGATSVTVEEAVAGNPFGFDVVGATTTSTAVTITGPVGATNAVTVDFTGLPAAGESIRLTLALPDGTSEDVVLTATTDTPPGENEFTIGATAAATAANFNTALDTAIKATAVSDLAAASSFAAADDFFANNPPLRVDGPPFDTATAYVAAPGPNDTVIWYVGEDGATADRETALARIDDNVTVKYGARANETALRWAFQHMAAFAVEEFSSSDPNAEARYEALAERIRPALDDPSGVKSPSSVGTDLAFVQQALEAAEERNKASDVMIADMINEIEGIDQEEVAMRLLSLQTRLQASYQVTSILSQLTLTNYL